MSFVTGYIHVAACYRGNKKRLWAGGVFGTFDAVSGVIAAGVSGLNSSCQAWCVRVKAFKQTSASQVIRSLSANGTQVGFGYLKGRAAGLIVSSVLADMLDRKSVV